MIRETSDGLKVYASIWKVLLLMSFFAAFVVLGIYELQRPDADPIMAFLDWFVIAAFGCLFALACLFCAPFVLMPKLVTHRGGLIERKLFHEDHAVDWPDVAGIGIVENHGGGRFRPKLHAFVVALKDGEDDIDVSPSTTGQVGTKRHQSLYHLPIVVMTPSILLPIHLERMVHRIAEKHAAELAEYGIFVETLRLGRNDS